MIYKYRCRVKDIKFHDLRKTFISWLAQTGSHPKVAMRLAGHSDVKITMDVYTGISRDELKAGINRLHSFESSRKIKVVKGGKGEERDFVKE